jgi:hypothetical protein
MVLLILGAGFRPESGGGIDEFKDSGSSLGFPSAYACAPLRLDGSYLPGASRHTSK